MNIPCKTEFDSTNGIITFGGGGGGGGTSTFADGTALAPSIAFTNALSTGFFLAGANQIGITANGTQVGTIDSSGVHLSVSLHAANGSANNPSIAFFSDQTTGFYRQSSNTIGITINSSAIGTISSAGLELTAGSFKSTLGTLTTSTPALDASQTWNAAGTTFTGLKLNVTDNASATASLLMDLQVGGASMLKLTKAGILNFKTGQSQPHTVIQTQSGTISDTAGGTNGIMLSGGGCSFSVSTWGAMVTNGFKLGWFSSPSSAVGDVGFGRVSAGLVEINDSVTTGNLRDLTLRSLLPASGTITADTPLISGTQTWNSAGTNFTALKLNVTNTASGASSNLLDLQVDSTSKFKVDKSGNATIGSTLGITNNNINSAAAVSVTQNNYGAVWGWNGNHMYLYCGQMDYGHTSNNYAKTSLVAGEDATGLAGTFEFRTGNNGSSGAYSHRLRVYNTWTSSTNYERLMLGWTTNVAQIYTEKGSGGGTARDLVLGTNATTAITISGTDQSVTTSGALSDSIGNVRSIPQNAKTATYTLIASDNGKHISITTGGVILPAGVFSAGQVVTIFNNSSSNQTIDSTTNAVTTYLAGTATTGNRTLAQYGVATVLCVASNTFVITGSGLT